MDTADELKRLRPLHAWGYADQQSLALERLLASDTPVLATIMRRKAQAAVLRAYKRAARL